ncbi:ribulose-phosphate 3-epimerase [Nanoarchaeota archaeon]
MTEKRIVPSLIAASQEELDKLMDNVKDATDLFQLDIMDGVFVKNHSLDFDFRLPEANYEAHLMVSNPKNWIELKADKADTILAHIEACNDPAEIIEMVRQKGRRVGFALNPETPVELIRPYLDRIDQVLVMTVNPGTYGAEFLPETLDKVRELRKLAPGIDIEVDGSINKDTIKLAADAGANLFVSGSFIIKADDPKSAIAELKKEVERDGQE